MLTRFHKISIVLLVAQLALAAVMLLRDDDYAAEKPQPLLAGFDAAQVTRLQIASKDKPVDLVKRDGAWVLASSFDYPVEESKVTDLLSQLAKLSAASPIARQASRHKQLGVADDDFTRKLIVTANGKDTTLFVGNGSGLRRTAIRLAGDARVFGVSGVSSYSIGNEPRQWVQTTYSQIPTDDIAKVVVQKAGATTEIVAGDAALDAEKVTKLISSVATIDLVAPADPKRDASKPTATITIEKKAKDASTPAPIVIDVIEDGTNYWVKTRGAVRAVLVEKSRLAKVVDADRAKLVKQAPPKAS
jgi:hypothetical protein